MRGLRRTLGLLACIAFGPAAAAEAAQPRTVRLSGTITDESWRDLQQRITPETRRLVIQSHASNGRAAIAVGRWVHENGIEVEIDGYCVSFCALYVLPAAARVIADENDYVGFDASYSSRAAMVARSGALIPPKALRDARSEGWYFGAIEASERLLYLPQIMIGTSCQIIAPGPPRGERQVMFQSRRTWWTPSAGAMRALGIRLEGTWPTSDAQLIRSGLKMPITGKFNVMLGEQLEIVDGAAASLPTVKAMRARLEALPVCSSLPEISPTVLQEVGTWRTDDDTE